MREGVGTAGQTKLRIMYVYNSHVCVYTVDFLVLALSQASTAFAHAQSNNVMTSDHVTIHGFQW